MAYIGRSVDKISNIETLDNITFDGSSSYSLTKNSVGFSPSASQNILISIDGVVQSGNFTVSGSTIDFGVAISSSSVCNFIIHLGVGLVTSPSDGSVGTSQLASNAVTNAKINDGEITNAKISSTAGIATTKLGTGAVLQVVQTGTTTSTSTTSTTFVDTALTASITPSSTSNKILVLCQCTVRQQTGSANGSYMAYQIFRDGTGIGQIGHCGTRERGSDLDHVGSSSILSALDTPSSTSSVTYIVKIKSFNSAVSGYLNDTSGGSGTGSTMTLMEIAG